MKTFNITVAGKTMGDIEAALQEASKLIVQDEFLSGMNRNEDGWFRFTSDGDFETQEIIETQTSK